MAADGRTRGRGNAGYVALAMVAGAVPLTFLVVFFVIPVLGMLREGVAPDGTLDLTGLLDALWRPRVLRVAWFTLWTSAVATLVTVVLGLASAYVLYRLRFPGQQVLRGLMVVPFVLPTVVVGVAFRTLLAGNGPLSGWGLDGTPVAIVLALVFFNIAVIVRTVGPWWSQLDPRRGEAAAALGATPFQVLRTVTLPALRPALTSGATVVFLFCATAFGVVLTLGGLRYSTVETEIYLLTTQFLDLRGAAALSLLQIAVIVVLLVLTGRARRDRQAAGERAGRTRRGAPPGLRDLPALVGFALSLMLVVLPVATLVLRSLRVDGGWSAAAYRDLNDAGSSPALVVPVTEALGLSLRVAVDATALALFLGITVSVLVTRPVSRRWLSRVASTFDGVFMLPLGVSAVTVGFGFLITLDEPPLDFRASPWLVPIAQAMVALPLVIRTVVPALRGVEARQREVAATLGASPLRVLGTIDLPVVWRPFLAAAGFAFAVSLGEFGATSFLAQPDRPTLPVLIYQLISRPGPENFALALSASVVLGLATTVVLLTVERLRVNSVGAF